MEDYKSEIEDWDLGAGIYISFYILKNSMQEDNSTMTELVMSMMTAGLHALFSKIEFT